MFIFLTGRVSPRSEPPPFRAGRLHNLLPVKLTVTLQVELLQRAHSLQVLPDGSASRAAGSFNQLGSSSTMIAVPDSSLLSIQHCRDGKGNSSFLEVELNELEVTTRPGISNSTRRLSFKR